MSLARTNKRCRGDPSLNDDVPKPDQNRSGMVAVMSATGDWNTGTTPSRSQPQNRAASMESVIMPPALFSMSMSSSYPSIFERKLTSDLEPRPISYTGLKSNPIVTLPDAQPAPNAPWPHVRDEDAGLLTRQSRSEEGSSLKLLRYLLQEPCVAEFSWNDDQPLTYSSFFVSNPRTMQGAGSAGDEANESGFVQDNFQLPNQDQREEYSRNTPTNLQIRPRFEQQLLPTIFDSERFMKMDREEEMGVPRKGGTDVASSFSIMQAGKMSKGHHTPAPPSRAAISGVAGSHSQMDTSPTTSKAPNASAESFSSW